MQYYLQPILHQFKAGAISKASVMKHLRRLYARKLGYGMFHPLVGQNVSDFSGIRFRTEFSGEEFFFADHLIQGQRAMPGVAYLEIALAAFKQAYKMTNEEAASVRFQNVSWVKPLMINESTKTIEILLNQVALEGGERIVEFSIVTAIENTPRESLCVGTLFSLKKPEENGKIDILKLKKDHSCIPARVGDLYAEFRRIGIGYGPSHQGISELYQGRHSVLARIELPKAISNTENDYFIHPAIADSAMQTSLSLVQASESRIGDCGFVLLPFNLQSAHVLRRCETEMWAHSRYIGSEGNGSECLIDIDLVNAQGEVCLKLEKLCFRRFNNPTARTIDIPNETKRTVEQIAYDGISLMPVWEREANCLPQLEPNPMKKAAILCDEPAIRDAIKRVYSNLIEINETSDMYVNGRMNGFAAFSMIDHLIWVAPEMSDRRFASEETSEDPYKYVLSCFRMVKLFLAAGYGKKDLELTVITRNACALNSIEKSDPMQASVHGFVGAVAKEYANWKFRVVDIDQKSMFPVEVIGYPSDPCGDPYVYRGGRTYRLRLAQMNNQSQRSSQSKYKKGGIYIAIGGAGGIGEAWSEYLIRNYQAQIIWVGRREKNETIEGKIVRLSAFGPAPLYLRADATDRNELENVLIEVKRRFSRVHGIVHSAIELLDQSLEKMDEERFKAVFRAKACVSMQIKNVFMGEELDFVMFFSSLISFMKSAGQSNYAAGCTFKDAFAHELSRSWNSCLVKVVNWGFWGSVGVVASDVYRERMAQVGVGSIEPEEAMEVLENLLVQPVRQMAFVKMQKNKQLDVMKGASESVTVYPLLIPSAIKNKASPIQSLGNEVRTARSNGGIFAEQIEGLAMKIAWSQLRSIGLFTDGATCCRLSEKYGTPQYLDLWLNETRILFTELSSESKRDDTEGVAVENIEDPQRLWIEWKSAMAKAVGDPELATKMPLIDATIRNLPEIVTGKIRATDVVFPGASMKLVEGIYKGNKVADFFNHAIADVLDSYMEERLTTDPTNRIKILEIGAGTGGTSEILFKRLERFADHIEEYCYSDISRAFLLHAESTFGPYVKYLNYKLLDLHLPLSHQGFGQGDYDVVVAANSVHAAKDIALALRNIKWALKRNGILVLNELFGKSVFTHLTFGLLEGWWHYDDQELRMPGSPGLPSESWQIALANEGYRSIAFPLAEFKDLGQQIVVAESDGIVRHGQRHESKIISDETIALHRSAGSSLNHQGESEKMQSRSVTKDKDFVKETILDKLSESLKVDRGDLTADVPFAEFGLDSILGVNLVQNINKALRITLSTTSVFEHRCVNDLADHVIATFKESMEAPPKSTVSPTIMVKSSTSDSCQAADEPEPDSVYKVPKDETRKNTSELSAHPTTPREPIAIIGVSGRFGKCDSVKMLWEHVREGKELIEEVSRWDSSQLNYGDENDCNAYCRFGSFLPRINEFDPSFFNISGMEATFMDPQQRFFLEESWKALEDAGYVGDSMRGKRCGVYVGHTGSDYDLLFTKGIKEPSQAFWGNAGSIIPARVSYCLDLQGPAIAIDTACSGSLVAFHLACQSLWIDEIEMALAGGVFIQSTPKFYRLANRAHMLSPSGHCYAFDQRADGFVPGEGVGVAVLKRLHDAIKDGDHIYGVIRGSGTNQDGKTNGIIAPSAASQEKLLSSVYDTFQLNPEKIQLVEAHGTGTKLGDPIEFSALTRAFRRFTNKNNYCAVGSVKTNIGHTAAAAGVAGVIKVLLAFQNKTLPPSPTFHKENNEIQIESSPFYINTEAKPWSMSAGEKRCAAVSSFGFSGTNAHLVIEEMAENRRISPAKPVYLFVFSARTMDQLRQIAQRMISFLKSNRDTDIGNLSYTLIVGRKTFNCRLACVAKSVGELISRLENWHSGEGNDSIFIGELWETGLSGSNDGMRLGNVHITNCLTASNEDEYVENLSILARMFVENPELPLGQLFNPDMYGRISLPTYPFAKEGYWVCEDNRHSEDVHKKESVQIDTRDQGKVLAAVRPGGTESRIQVESKIHFYEEVLAEVDLPVCVQIEAKTLVIFSSRTVDQNHFKAAFAKNQPMVKLIFVAQSERSVKLSDTRYDLESGDVCAMESTLSAIIQDHGPLDGIFYAWPIEEPFRFQDYIPLIRIVQSNAKLTGGAKRIVIVGQYTNGIERCYLEALIGLERSIGMVVPTMHICLAIQEVSPKEKGVLNETLLDIARRTFYRSEMKTILWLGGKAYAYQVRPKSIEREFNYVKSNGTYLITGGAGALGLLTAKYFACICKVNIVLLGRSNLAQSRREEIESIEGIGSRILYLQADICNRDDVENVLKRIEATFGKVSGVVHAAGICLDTSILNKNEDEFLRVLSPKMAGTSLLDELIDDSALDFVCYFSSSSAILGDFGFCDYAIGNRFLMAYGIQRNRLVQEGLKRGRTIVINWPMWKDGNMGFVDSEQAEGYLKLSGQQYLESTVGMQILDTILSNSGSQAMVLVGEKSKIRELVKGKTIRELPERSMTDPSLKRRGDESGVGQNLQEELVRIVGEILLIKQEKISVDTIFADLGFDSLSLASFAEALSKHFSVQISPATFFGHSTIKSLATYLFDTHGAEIVQRLQRVYPPSTIIPDEKNTPPPEVPRETEASIKVIKPESLNEPIAIIGMSGRFPGADNVDSLWQLFFTGRDAISDIPPQRLALGNFKTNHQGAPHGLRCGWLSDVDMFDSSFFEITPLEAEGMDPRQRILLQEAWNALENAGYGPRLLEKGKIGMFVGVEDGDYYAAGEKPSLVTSNHNGILASRLAYFLNFHGPVMAINTACSSGLVAVHQACLSLRNNECEVALASGANILFSHQAFEGMTNVGMLSKDGICRAFDRGANGTVPGEAVAVVVLKKLGKAIEDGNQILAVIKASGINYDGKTNGITAPSHVSQAQLLKDIYSSLDISGDGIQYVIAHGTGTKLGDPVEILALNEAFSSLTARKKFCAVTSTKPTLGHSMATSGIVNLICMISALKNQCIPASLNCTHENELVNWEDSAVYINKEAKSWPENSNGKRIGAVSAFGMSGTNAHLVIEGYTERKINSSSSNERPFPCILCLSAKTPEALKRKVLDMIDFLKRRSNGYSLRELSFTLLEGRHHFDFRVAAVVNTIEHAIQTLEKSIAGEKPENVFEGTKAVGFVEQHALKRLGALIAVEIGGDKSRDGTKCLENLQVLADLYRKGYTIDWRQLFAENPPDSICLPTYPFQKNHHWKSNPAQSGKTRAIADENKGLHPLVHRNTATLSQFRFSSSFSGSEPYISDHNVNGSKTIPGVAFMEMALAATILSDESNSGVAGTCFENIIWGEIAKCEGRLLDIDVLLYPKNDGSLSYNIRGANTGNVQGRDFSKGIIRKKRIDEDDNVDIEKIKSECGIAHVNHDQFYMFCLEMGFEYGERYRGVRNVYVGRNEVLAEIAILQTADESCDRYLLNPGLIDSSLQASICLFFDTNKMGITMPIEGALPVPNALKAFSIYTNIFPNKLWSRIRFSDPKRQAGRQRVIDIEIFNEKGVLIAKFEELTIHFHNMSLTAMQTPESSNAVMMTPLWKYAESVTVFSTSGNVQHVIVLCGLSRIQSSIVKSFHPQTDVITIGSQEERLDKLFGDYASKIFSIIKKQLTVHSDDQVIVQVMYGMDDRHGILAGMQGLLRTAHKENPRFIGQLIGVPINLSDSEAVAIIRENLQCRIELCVRYKDNHRFALDWEECIHAPIQVGSWQSESIYLITGGAGMLGLVLAESIARGSRNSKIILVGRSDLSQEKKDRIDKLSKNPVRIKYMNADISDAAETNQIVDSILREHGRLDVIIHCAGITNDNFIIKKNSAEFERVLAPKVNGLVNIDEASKNLRIQQFILFSSASAVLGNVGQSDYATANAFMDEFVTFRTEMVRLGERFGHTISINWPLWNHGGMGMDQIEANVYSQKYGAVGLESSTGIELLLRCMALELNRVMILPNAINQLEKAKTAPIQNTDANSENKYKVKRKIEAIEERVKRAIASTTKLDINAIHSEVQFEKFGVDSIAQAQIVEELEREFGELPKTLLFEYRTTREVAGYLTDHRAFDLKQSESIPDTDIAVDRKTDSVEEEISFINETTQESGLGVQAENISPLRNDPGDVAIIGMSGCYPHSLNLEKLWENLVAGRNCIEAFPEYRMQSGLLGRIQKDVSQKERFYGGFLSNVQEFDRDVFEIEESQVAELPLELRLLLKIAWETFEDAGYTKAGLKSAQDKWNNGVGVYVGCMYNQNYLNANTLEEASRMSNLTDWQIANRISYHFGLTGPSLSVNTACSSSLTAIHLAYEALKANNCCMAIASGVNLSLDRSKFEVLRKRNLLATGKVSKSLGDGDGFLPGEGAGAVLLKPYSLARADRDRIYAVIKSSSLNHAGDRQAFGSPDPIRQANLIINSLTRSGVDPETISYVESAANGSDLGDAVEFRALCKAFAHFTAKKQFCAIGSVKSNIGHLEAASGIAQLTKVLLQMCNETLVPSINAKPINPNVNMQESPFFLQDELSPWTERSIPDSKERIPRRSMINSFGAGGAYANVIVEHVQRSQKLVVLHGHLQPCEQLFLFSAKTKDSLMDYLARMERFLSAHAEESLKNIAYTLWRNCHEFAQRIAIVAGSIDDLHRKLEIALHNTEMDGECDVYRTPSFPIVTDGTEPGHVLNNMDLRRMASLWVGGAAIDISNLYRGEEFEVISLPKYSFCPPVGLMNEGKGFGLSKCQLNDIVQKVVQGEITECQFVNAILAIRGSECIAS